MKRTVPVAMKDGALLHVHLQGDPTEPAVVQLSGGPGYVAYVADTDWCRPAFVITPEARGVRDSAGSSSDLAQTIADLEDVRVHLELDSWAVVGHSWGADRGLAYTLAHPERVRVLVHACGTGLQNDRDWSAVQA
jgi:proline iminopeptidase